MTASYFLLTFKDDQIKPTMQRDYKTEPGLMRGVRLEVENEADIIFLRRIKE